MIIIILTLRSLSHGLGPLGHTPFERNVSCLLSRPKLIWNRLLLIGAN